jgi:hypothetical protein
LLYPIVFRKDFLKEFDSKKFFLQNKLKLLIVIIVSYFVFSRINNAMSIGTNPELAFLYITSYFGFFSHAIIIILFSIIGLYYCFKENKELTIMLLLPTILLLLLIFFVELFAFRYIYFIAFPIIIFFPIMFWAIAKKYDKFLLIMFFIVIFFTSNLFNPFLYSSVLIPIQRNYNDFSAPEINYKDIPNELLLELKQEDSRIITLYSPHVEWYIKKPFLIIPFSMSGKGSNTISRYNPEIDKNVDVYSGQEFVVEKPIGKFFFIGDTFSLSKLKPFQITHLETIIDDCVELYKNNSIVIKKCS